jgi:hypothetical protein
MATTSETTSLDLRHLMREIERYLEVVEFFRQQGCKLHPRDGEPAPAWQDELG